MYIHMSRSGQMSLEMRLLNKMNINQAANIYTPNVEDRVCCCISDLCGVKKSPGCTKGS